MRQDTKKNENMATGVIYRKKLASMEKKLQLTDISTQSLPFQNRENKKLKKIKSTYIICIK
jgi:hypothetical protein